MTEEEAYGRYQYDQAQAAGDDAAHLAAEGAAAQAQAEAETEDDAVRLVNYHQGFRDGNKSGRRVQHQADVEWLQKYAYAVEGHIKLRSLDWQVFKQMHIS